MSHSTYSRGEVGKTHILELQNNFTILNKLLKILKADENLYKIHFIFINH